MDAQTLFREGVTAIREKKDVAAGRKLITQSLQLDPNNDIAWVWLARVVADPNKRLQCLERALRVNPGNQQARALQEQVLSQLSSKMQSSDLGISPSPAPKTTTAELLQTTDSKPTMEQEKRIKILLNKAEVYMEEDDADSALEQWLAVLEMKPDHELALRSAVRVLSRQGFLEDAKHLVHEALESGTTAPSIYLTAIDFAEREGNPGEADDLRERLVKLPSADDTVVAMVADHFVEQYKLQRAMDVLQGALETHPKSQKLLTRLGDLLKDAGREQEALVYYERAARLGARGKSGKELEQRLQGVVPIITDKERGSTLLAMREALSFGLIFLLIGWQDAGTDLALMGSRWLGVLLALLGGYLVITATSSPQQQPLARLLGGRVPQPKPKKVATNIGLGADIEVGPIEEETSLPAIAPGLRAVFGLVGLALLVFAFTLVFPTAFSLWGNTLHPDVPTIDELMTGY